MPFVVERPGNQEGLPDLSLWACKQRLKRVKEVGPKELFLRALV